LKVSYNNHEYKSSCGSFMTPINKIPANDPVVAAAVAMMYMG
jgi:hypothetical protein